MAITETTSLCESCLQVAAAANPSGVNVKSLTGKGSGRVGPFMKGGLNIRNTPGSSRGEGMVVVGGDSPSLTSESRNLFRATDEPDNC